VPARVAAGEFPDGVAASTDGQDVYVADATGSVGQFGVNAAGALSPLSPFQVASGQQTGAIAVTPLPPGTFLGCRLTATTSTCFYQEGSGESQECVNGTGPTTIPCGPLWGHFTLSHSNVTATLKLHLSTRFPGAGQAHLRPAAEADRARIAAQRPHARALRARAPRAGHKHPPDPGAAARQEAVLGPNALTLHLTPGGNGQGPFFNQRRETQQAPL
jgi:hypothetical protein